MSAENIEKFFNKIDGDGSGSITVGELNQLFSRFDKDGEYQLYLMKMVKLWTFIFFINIKWF